MGGELGFDRGRGPESRVIEHRQILAHGASSSLWRQAFGAGTAALPVGIGADQTGIDRKALAADQTLFQAAAHRASRRAYAPSNTSRRRSLSRNRPCRFFEKVE